MTRSKLAGATALLAKPTCTVSFRINSDPCSPIRFRQRLNEDGSITEGPTLSAPIKFDQDKGVETFETATHEKVRGAFFATSNIGGGYILPVDESSRTALSSALLTKARISKALARVK